MPQAPAGENVLSVIVLVAAALGLIVNTLVVLGVAWKGGGLIERLNSAVSFLSNSMKTLSEEVAGLRRTVEENATILTRTVVQLDGLERRTSELEDWRNRDRRS